MCSSDLATVPTQPHPHEMVFSPDGRFAYTTDNGTMRIEQAGTGGNTVSIIDLKLRKKVGEISLGEFRRPHGIDRIQATGQILVSTELPDQLLLIDPEKRQVVKRWATGGKTAHMVVATRDGKFDIAFTVTDDFGLGSVALYRSTASAQNGELVQEWKEVAGQKTLTSNARIELRK